MNLTQYKNQFKKYFEKIEQNRLLGVETNGTDLIQLSFLENEKEKLVSIKANIQTNEQGLLDFRFSCAMKTPKVDALKPLLDKSIDSIDGVELYEARDMFCTEQALEFTYNKTENFYVLIYTDMAEMTLEIFDEPLTAPKFKKVTF